MARRRGSCAGARRSRTYFSPNSKRWQPPQLRGDGTRIMRRITFLTRVLAVAATFASALFSAQPSAVAQAPGPESFARNPKTPLELWDAIDYLVRVGQASQAVPYLEAFRKANPDDTVMLEIRDDYGPGSIMRLNDDPATREQARPLMDMLAAA